MTELPTFVVPRSTWLRGKGSSKSRLLLPDGMRCCLGHIARQLGIDDAELLNQPDPSTVQGRENLWPEALLESSVLNGVDNSDLCGSMMHTNDSTAFHEPDRESRLQVLALQAGFILEFVDDVPGGEP